MLRRLALSLTTLAFLTLPAAASPGRSAALIDVLRLPEIIEIMREEGLSHGAEIGESLLGPRAGPGWEATVARIYSADRMLRITAAALDEALPADDAALEAMVNFFAGDLGRRVVQLEITARRAMLEDAVDEAAREAWAEMVAADDPRIPRLQRFADAGDLVEENVAGGLNSTFAFYMGLIDAGSQDFPLGQADILADVWAQEAGIRAEIEEWLFAYLALAFRPLEDAELDAYIEFFETRYGRALSTALFAGFHTLFETISRDLGRAAGQMLQGEDL